MPIELAIMAPLSRAGLTQDQLRATGFTTSVFEPFLNDIQFDRNKLIMTYTGTDKLAQSILRIILTDKGTYSEDASWGSACNTLIGSKFDQARFAKTQQSIIDALKHYNEINQDNPNSDEVIETIDELRVVQDLADPRKMRIFLGVTSESGKSFRVSVPQVEG